MATETNQLSHFGRSFRWLNRFGLLIPLVIGLFLVALVSITLVSPRYHSPQVVNAGAPAEYAVGEPHFFEDQRFWLVRLPAGEADGPDGEFVALYDRDPATGCTLPFGVGLEHMGVTGWFRDACSGSIYDLPGACFGGPCYVGLNRLNVSIVAGEIMIDPRDGPGGQLAINNGEPVNPPQ